MNEGWPGHAPTALTKEIAAGLIFNSRYRLTWGTRIPFVYEDDSARAYVRTLIYRCDIDEYHSKAFYCSQNSDCAFHRRDSVIRNNLLVWTEK